MAAEKLFENKLKRWLETLGIYALGTPKQKMDAEPIGYYEKRWGGGYTKSGLPDLHIVVNGKSVDVEIKAPNGRPSELQLFTIRQINDSMGLSFVLYQSSEHVKKFKSWRDRTFPEYFDVDALDETNFKKLIERLSK